MLGGTKDSSSLILCIDSAQQWVFKNAHEEEEDMYRLILI